MPPHTAIQAALTYVCDKLPLATAPPVEKHPQLIEEAEAYWSLLQRWNAKIKLTGAQTPAQFADRHLVDSLFGLALLGELPEDATILDVGAGAGFPGVPLAMVYPEHHWDLAESRQRRCMFLSQLQRTLKLTKVKAHTTRIAGDPVAEGLRTGYDRLLFRAVAPEQILPLAHLYLQPQGKVLYWGTQAETPAVPDTLVHEDTFAYTLPTGEDFAIYLFALGDRVTE